MTFDKQKCTEYIENVFMGGVSNHEMNESQLQDASTFYVGAQWQAQQDEKREQKLLESVAILKAALKAVQRQGICHYIDCSNYEYEDYECDCGMEKTEKVVLDALTKIAELENELR